MSVFIIHIRFSFCAQSLKSSSVGSCTRRRTVALTFPRSRRKKATASLSLTFPGTWSSPRTIRAPGRWRLTRCREDATRSGRCWRRRASVSCHRNHSGERVLCNQWSLWRCKWKTNSFLCLLCHWLTERRWCLSEALCCFHTPGVLLIETLLLELCTLCSFHRRNLISN